MIYHLVEREIYLRYLTNLFSASRRLVLVYSSDKEQAQTAPNVRHRSFTVDVAAQHGDFRLIRTVENRYPKDSACSFFLFERQA